MPSPEYLIFDYLNIIFIINKLLGNFIFNKDFKLSKLTFLFVVSFSIFRAHNVYDFILRFSTENVFSFYILATNRSFNAFCFIFLSLLTYFKAHKLKKVIYDLSRLDLYLFLVDVKVKYDKKRILKYCIGRFFMYGFMGSIRFINGTHKFSILLAYEGFHRVAAVYYHNLIFVSLTCAISDHFEILAFELGRKKKRGFVKKIVFGTKRLYEIWETFYDFYGLQILVYSAVVFVQVIEVYRALRQTVFQNWRSLLESLSWREMSSLFFSFEIAIIALLDTKQYLDVYATAKKNADLLTLKLSRIYVHNDLEQSTRDLLGVHFAMKPNLKFDAFGFYMIDNTLIFSMISTVVSYMIVLLQEEKSKNEDVKM